MTGSRDRPLLLAARSIVSASTPTPPTADRGAFTARALSRCKDSSRPSSSPSAGPSVPCSALTHDGADMTFLS